MAEQSTSRLTWIGVVTLILILVCGGVFAIRYVGRENAKLEQRNEALRQQWLPYTYVIIDVVRMGGNYTRGAETTYILEVEGQPRPQAKRLLYSTATGECWVVGDRVRLMIPDTKSDGRTLRILNSRDIPDRQIVDCVPSRFIDLEASPRARP